MESIRIFWAWWRDRLLELVPGYAARQLGRVSDGLVLADLDESGPVPVATVLQRRDGVEQARERLALTPPAVAPMLVAAARLRLPVVLRLPGQLLLEREVSLPLAAERDLARVLFYEMDRFTPFTGAEVVWSHTLAVRDRAAGRLVARLSLVPRAMVAGALEALAAAGIAVNALELLGADGERRRISLEQEEARRFGVTRLRLALAGLAALLLAAIASPFLAQAAAFAEVAHRMALLAPQVAAVQHLRGMVSANATGTEVIAAERKRAGDPLEAIALLTDAIPDDTYLTGLTYDAGKLTLDGQSKSAAALIAPLTANPRLQDAAFTAPVVRNTLGMDSFSLRVRVTR